MYLKGDYMSKYYTMRYDSVFKNALYRDEEILRLWLKDIFKQLKIDYSWNFKTLSVLNVELLKDTQYIKNKTVDMLLDLGTFYVNIEMHNNNFPDSIKNRGCYYMFSIFTERIKKKGTYDEIKPVVQLNFTFEGKKEQAFKKANIMIKEDNKEYINWFQIYKINLDKILDEWYNSDNKERFYNLFKAYLILGMKKMELKNLKDTSYIDYIRREVEKMNRDPEFFQALTDEEDARMVQESLKREAAR